MKAVSDVQDGVAGDFGDHLVIPDVSVDLLETRLADFLEKVCVLLIVLLKNVDRKDGSTRCNL